MYLGMKLERYPSDSEKHLSESNIKVHAKGTLRKLITYCDYSKRDCISLACPTCEQLNCLYETVLFYN